MFKDGDSKKLSPVLENFGNEIISFLDIELDTITQLKKLEKFLLPFFFMNPEKIDFNGKLYMLSEKILRVH